MKINILHLSDFHFSQQHRDDCRRFCNHLAESTSGSCIDAIIFSGDLIQGGNDDFDEAYKTLIEPVRQMHNLTMDRILIVPGNHDKTKNVVIDSLEENLYKSRTEEQVNSYFSDRKLSQASMNDFKHFNTFLKKRFGKEDYDGFGHISVFDIAGTKVGLVGFNSAWCCTRSENDRGNLMFPLNAAEQLFRKAQNCDIVLTSMHHNLADFKFFIAKKFEDIIQENSNILLTGHYHKQALNATLTPKGCLLHNVAPATYDKHEDMSSFGYCILTVNTETYEVDSSIFHYDGEKFKLVEHLRTTAMMSERKKKLYELRKTMQHHLGMLEIMADCLIPSDSQQRRGLTFEQLCACPDIVESESGGTLSRSMKPVRLQELEDNYGNVLITGIRKKERTSLLFKIWQDFLRQYDIKGIIPFYLDCTRYRKEKDFFSIGQQLQLFLGQTSSDMQYTFREKRLLLLLDDFEPRNKVFLKSLEDLLNRIPESRFIACARTDLANIFGTLRFNNEPVTRMYLKGFQQITPNNPTK